MKYEVDQIVFGVTSMGGGGAGMGGYSVEGDDSGIYNDIHTTYFVCIQT